MYLPPPTTELTKFPIPLGTDFWMQVAYIDEKWKRVYPLLTYHPLKKDTTLSVLLDGSVPVGVAGGTVFDPIYGEAVDPQMLQTGWQQPQLSGNLSSADVEVFQPSVQVNGRLQVETTDVDLHFYGFDRFLGLLVTVPASLFDSVGVSAQPGDRFEWGGDTYEVLQVGPNQRFRNTATMLYVGLNCQSYRKGS